MDSLISRCSAWELGFIEYVYSDFRSILCNEKTEIDFLEISNRIVDNSRNSTYVSQSESSLIQINPLMFKTLRDVLREAVASGQESVLVASVIERMLKDSHGYSPKRQTKNRVSKKASGVDLGKSSEVKLVKRGMKNAKNKEK
jgi:hypothetical protein